PNRMLLSSSIRAAVRSEVNGGQTTTVARAVADMPLRSAESSFSVSGMAAFIFQLPATICCRISRHPDFGFRRQHRDPGEDFPFEKLEGGAAAGRDMGHAIFK